MIVAHRGYAFRYPENTIEAFQAAVDAGAKWVEVDVQLQDGVPVLAHDDGVPGETLAEFAAWLESRPDITALVDLKSESLSRYGRGPVVSAVMETMRGAWHPISFNYGALQLAVDHGSRAPGWVVCRFDADVTVRARSLGARWLITNQIFMPETLPEGPWEWMIYEIENREQAENAMARGAKWLETMRVGELIEDLK